MDLDKNVHAIRGCSEMRSTKRGEGGVCKKMISDDSGEVGGLPKMMDDDDGLKGGSKQIFSLRSFPKVGIFGLKSL